MHALARLGPRARYRLALAAVLVVAAIFGVWTFGSSEASAHWPAPHVEAKCANDSGWAVSFSVESWKKSDKGGGGNPHINVAYQVDNGAWVTLPWKANYSFTSLNNFEFNDYFNVAAGNSSKVRIKVWTTDKWSDGYKNDTPQYSDWADLPKNCSPKPTTTAKPTTTKRPTTSTTCEETTTTKPVPPSTEATTTTKPVPPSTEATTTTKPVPPSTEATTTTKPVPPSTEAPTTTVAPTTTKPAPTTTAAPTTTKPAPTTTAAAPTTPAPAPTTTIAVSSSGSLPTTGLQTAGMLMLAAGLMLGGFLLVRAARAQG
jgi:hypothetical protein